MISFLKFLIPTRNEINHARREFWNLIASIKDFTKDPHSNPLDWNNIGFQATNSELGIGTMNLVLRAKRSGGFPLTIPSGYERSTHRQRGCHPFLPSENNSNA